MAAATRPRWALFALALARDTVDRLRYGIVHGGIQFPLHGVQGLGQFEDEGTLDEDRGKVCGADLAQEQPPLVLVLDGVQYLTRVLVAEKGVALRGQHDIGE